MTSHCGSGAFRSWPRGSCLLRSTSSSTISPPVIRRSGTEEKGMSKKTLTFALMDAPYESANLTTAFRILDAAAKRGHDINVFAYEGAAALAFTRQSPHPNPELDPENETGG